MMKKNKKILIYVLFLILYIMFSVFIFTDSIKASKNLSPKYAIQAINYEDGGSAIYIGLFYNVYRIRVFKDEFDDDGNPIVTMETYYEVGPWFKNIEKLKEKYK